MRGVGFPILVDDTLFFYAQWYRSEKSYSVYSSKSGLIALDAHTGTLQWMYQGIIHFSSISDINNLAPFCLTYDTGKIYIGTLSYVLCVDIETQELVWEYEDPQLFTSS
jgi:outer membrane protein assembly factor BamB